MANNKEQSKLVVPNWRPHDYTSKRGVNYWWNPEWIRDLNGSASKIRPMKDSKTGSVDLYMESKDGTKFTYIQGSIQREFRKWHEDRQIDYLLLGEDADSILDVDRSEATEEKRGNSTD
jgi:hypothetical protein